VTKIAFNLYLHGKSNPEINTLIRLVKIMEEKVSKFLNIDFINISTN
jgi:hypothetical protein